MIWLWRIMMTAAVPGLLLLGLQLATTMPHVLPQPDHPDRAQLIVWGFAWVFGILAILTSMRFKRRGHLVPATILAAMVGMPVVAALAFLLLIIGAFIVKS